MKGIEKSGVRDRTRHINSISWLNNLKIKNRIECVNRQGNDVMHQCVERMNEIMHKEDKNQYIV